ncbi:MAG TPA: pseudouridine synthase [Cyclobacteriaceae bacterium]|nr:pseudouridine synthase [Cyclobacteriaceae bacterium]
MPRYFVVYKPYGIQSQFSGEDSLKQIGEFPAEVYPVGRLDKDSEGLLLITDDKALNHYLLNPKFGHKRSYLVQVEGAPTAEALRQLEQGVDINLKGEIYRTKQAKASLQVPAPVIPERHPPIRMRLTVHDSWILLELTEGKNRQVRRMTAAVGFPTLRLVRWSMEDLTIDGYEVGEVREYSQEELYGLLKLKKNSFSIPADRKPGKYPPGRNKNRR